MVERYGEFVLLKPVVKPATWLLWFGPFAFAALAALGLLWAGARRPRAPAETLSSEEAARLAKILADRKGPPPHLDGEQTQETDPWRNSSNR